MTSLFDLEDNSSDSEDDVDYVPEEGQLSENDASDEEPVSSDEDKLPSDDVSGAKNRPRKRKKLPGKKVVETEDEPVKKVEEKVQAADVWKNFLEEVSGVAPKPVESSLSPSASSSATSSHETSDKDSTESNTLEKKPNQVYEFAGEVISLENDGSATSSASVNQELEGNPGKNNEKAEPAKRKGLQSVLGTLLNKKQKMTTLQKTALDWKSFKKDEGIEEELEKFNKGKGGFIERKRFLERSDLRSYEVERDIRYSKNKKH